MQPINVLTKVFTARTATGAEETIVHGEQGKPLIVQVVMHDSSKNYALSTAPDSTKVYVTADIGAVYDVIVWWGK